MAFGNKATSMPTSCPLPISSVLMGLSRTCNRMPIIGKVNTRKHGIVFNKDPNRRRFVHVEGGHGHAHLQTARASLPARKAMAP